MVKTEEMDRKSEWRGLKRMQCLITAFKDGQVQSSEVEGCKGKSYDTKHLDIKYYKLPLLRVCSVPTHYPNTPAYRKVEFSPLPALAKGKYGANECTAVQEISTTPKAGSPESCKCRRVTMNGQFSSGPIVKCTNCLDTSRSKDKNSCPDGTKLFSPRSRRDWKTFLASARPLRDPNWIVDITRPENGCGGCEKDEKAFLKSWRTSDDSPWWLQHSKFTKSKGGDYLANCYLNLLPDKVSPKWSQDRCSYHSRSYYCQAKKVSLKPKDGSPDGCVCEKVALTGPYSAGALLRCVGCLDVYRSKQKNSCPVGTKIFSPRSREDWKTFFDSAKVLPAPNFIVDVTRPQNGCGGCTRNTMNSDNVAQSTWRTSDGSPWWLRSTKYSEPNGDYKANCYLDLWKRPENEDSVTFNDHNCGYHANSYYCQPAK